MEEETRRKGRMGKSESEEKTKRFKSQKENFLESRRYK